LTIHDSPIGWVARHIRRYVATDGRDGHLRWGVTNLLLTTRGRRTGRLRRTALIYGRDGPRYVVVASGAGEDHHPAWYLNLSADPEVGVQVGASVFLAHAATAEGPERDRLWRMMAGMWPDYERYRRRAARTIPVVVLTPR
jgi:deazaflavin-dependent oxidoreductase (nitroreductase family)